MKERKPHDCQACWEEGAVQCGKGLNGEATDIHRGTMSLKRDMNWQALAAGLELWGGHWNAIEAGVKVMESQACDNRPPLTVLTCVFVFWIVCLNDTIFLCPFQSMKILEKKLFKLQGWSMTWDLAHGILFCLCAFAQVYSSECCRGCADAPAWQWAETLPLRAVQSRDVSRV